MQQFASPQIVLINFTTNEVIRPQAFWPSDTGNCIFGRDKLFNWLTGGDGIAEHSANPFHRGSWVGHCCIKGFLPTGRLPKLPCVLSELRAEHSTKKIATPLTQFVAEYSLYTYIINYCTDLTEEWRDTANGLIPCVGDSSFVYTSVFATLVRQLRQFAEFQFRSPERLRTRENHKFNYTWLAETLIFAILKSARTNQELQRLKTRFRRGILTEKQRAFLRHCRWDKKTNSVVGVPEPEQPDKLAVMPFDFHVIDAMRRAHTEQREQYDKSIATYDADELYKLFSWFFSNVCDKERAEALLQSWQHTDTEPTRVRALDIDHE